MEKLKVGDKVRLANYDKEGGEIVLWEGVVIALLNVGDAQFCTVEVAEQSGAWSHLKLATAFADRLEKIEG